MRNVRFVIAQVDNSAQVNDLSAMLVGISGVAAVAAERATRVLDVEYDPLFVNPQLMRSSIEGSGYSVSDQSESE